MADSNRDLKVVALLFVVLAAVAALALAGINREVTFYDSGVYLVTAKGIASGLGYRNTNLPGAPPQGLYPPVVPSLLAAIWWAYPAFPANVAIMKMGIAAVGLLFLFITYRYLITFTGHQSWEALGIVALVGFNPLFVTFLTEPSSEILYAFCSIVTLYTYSRFVERGDAKWFAAAATSLAVTLMTRSVGIALLISILVDALRRRRVTMTIMFAVVGAVVIVPWTAWSWSAQQAYADYPPAIAANYRGYLVNLLVTNWLAKIPHALLVNAFSFAANCGLWVFPWVPVRAALGICVGLLLLGSRERDREQGLIDTYCAATAALILLWPWPQNGRFVLVLSPFLVAYTFHAIAQVAGKSEDGALFWKHGILAAVVAAGLCYDLPISAAEARSRALPDSILADFHEMASWIKTNTEPSAILVAPTDPSYYLFTDRNSIRLAYPDPFTVFYDPVRSASFPHPDDFVAWFRNRKACYFVRNRAPMIPEVRYYSALIESLQRARGGSMDLVHQSANRTVDLLKLHNCD